MAENKNTVEQESTPEKVEPQTFTQADIDRIVQERLTRERAKFADYETLKEKASKYDQVEEANKSELQKATERALALENELNGLKKANEIRQIKEKVAGATGVPLHLLTGETEEACTAQAKAIMEFASGNAKPIYPSVKDGGDPKIAPMTKAEILAITDERKRLKAIEEHIDLFK